MATTHHVRDTTVKARHPLGVVALGLITLGVYSLFWWYFANRELRDTGGDGSPAVSVLAVTVGALAVVPPLVSTWNTADRIRRVQEDAGSASPTRDGVASREEYRAVPRRGRGQGVGKVEAGCDPQGVPADVLSELAGGGEPVIA